MAGLARHEQRFGRKIRVYGSTARTASANIQGLTCSRWRAGHGQAGLTSITSHRYLNIEYPGGYQLSSYAVCIRTQCEYLQFGCLVAWGGLLNRTLSDPTASVFTCGPT